MKERKSRESRWMVKWHMENKVGVKKTNFKLMHQYITVHLNFTVWRCYNGDESNSEKPENERSANV